LIAQAVGEEKGALKRAFEAARVFMENHGTPISVVFDFANLILHMVGLVLSRTGARGVVAAVSGGT
jgi:hypothetical protein